MRDLFLDRVRAALVRVERRERQLQVRRNDARLLDTLGPLVYRLVFVGLELDPVVEAVLLDNVVDVRVVP